MIGYKVVSLLSGRLRALPSASHTVLVRIRRCLAIIEKAIDPLADSLKHATLRIGETGKRSADDGIVNLSLPSPVYVHKPQRVVRYVRIQIPTLRVYWVLIRQRLVRACKPSLCRREVSSSEVIKPGRHS